MVIINNVNFGYGRHQALERVSLTLWKGRIYRRLVAGTATAENTFVISTHQVCDLENLINPVIILDENKVLVNDTVYSIVQTLGAAGGMNIAQLFITLPVENQR